MSEKRGIGTFINDEFELGSNSLDLFTVPPVDTTLVAGKSIKIYPNNALNDLGPFEFIIPNEGVDYTILPLTRIEGELEVVKADGSALAGTDAVSVVNLFPISIFKQVECEINNVQICDLSTPTYAYKGFLETHLSYGEEAKSTHLKTSMYIKDTLDKENNVNLADETAFKTRNALIQGKKVFFSSLVHVDLFQCNRLLIPGCQIKLKFIRNDDTFSLLGATAGPKIKIHNLYLNLRRVTLDQKLHERNEKQLETTPAYYNITQSKIKTYVINSGTQSLTIPNIFRGNLPRSLMFGFVDARGFNGTISVNPFKFENFKLKYVNLKKNSEPVVGTVFQPNFSSGNYIREYRFFMDNIGIAHDNGTNSISPEEWAKNSNLWVYDLTPDLCNSFHLHKTETGNIDLDIAFEDATTKNIQMIVYASFNEAVLIDFERNVTITTQ